jgi:hypothetical protein
MFIPKYERPSACGLEGNPPVADRRAVKRSVAVLVLLCAGCAAVTPVPGPVQSPHTPLVVLENSGRSATNVDRHYEDVNRLTEELFESP